jgi:hypothetical protein
MAQAFATADRRIWESILGGRLLSTMREGAPGYLTDQISCMWSAKPMIKPAKMSTPPGMTPSPPPTATAPLRQPRHAARRRASTLRDPDNDDERGVPTPPLGVNGDKH